MVRYSNRRYKRRSYRRSSRKTLSTRNIYNRKSSTAQANQIYALRKSITSINRRFRPEIKTIHNWGQASSKTLTSGSLSDSYFGTYFQWPAVGTGDDQRIGDKIRVKNIQWNLQFEYYNNSTTGYHISESAGTPVRIIIIRTKEQVNPANAPTLGDILSYSGYTGDNYTARATSPFVHGINDTYKIMYDKLIYLTTNHNQKCLRIFTGPQTITFNADGNKAIHYYLFVAPTGLHWDSDFKEYVQLVYTGKCAYTDY